MNDLAPLALTMGDPAGIGGEVALKAWLARDSERVPVFFVLDDVNRLEALARRLGVAVPIQPIAAPGEALPAFAASLPVLSVPLVKPAEPGRPDPGNAPAVLESIDRAVALTRTGLAAAIVTNPIHKQSLYGAGFPYPGHTEYLATRTDPSARPVMMLACPGLRVVPATVHIPVAEVARRLNRSDLVALGFVVAAALRADFGVDQPRLALAGLNPHAGEGGTIGREEIEILAPAVSELREAGVDIHGPAPADTLFHAEARQRYDVAICLYHDQALIPLKTIDFWSGVNITLGLPIVRTSPDHGTAFDLAGTGRADPRSLVAALKTAALIAARRSGHGD